MAPPVSSSRCQRQLLAARAPWALPAFALAVLVYRHISGSGSGSTAHQPRRGSGRPRTVAKRTAGAAARAKQPAVAPDACDAPAEQQQAPQPDQEAALADAVLGRDQLLEWFTEDEVEALQQAQANPQSFLALMQQ